MRTAERRTRKAGSSLAYWAFVSFIQILGNGGLCLHTYTISSVTDLPILEITIDLLWSVEQVEHLKKNHKVCTKSLEYIS